jgi:DNA-binding GntR family transcriptional regulator
MSKADEIFDILRQEIISFKYPVGEPINEKAVAEAHGVSKTPAREALNMLVQRGYLTKLPRQGYFVNEVSEVDYFKLLYLRFTLEKGVVAHIVANCTDQEIESLYDLCKDTEVSQLEYAVVNRRFHIGMAELTGNEFLVEAVRETLERMLRVPSRAAYMRYLRTPHARHKLLIESLKARDLEKANFYLREECRRDDDIELWF